MFRSVPVRSLFLSVASCICLLASPASIVPGPAVAESNFPFGQELLLDVKPLRGSKRVPSLEIAANGATTIDLWCNRVQSQIVVTGATISILRGPVIVRECAPERVARDDALLEALLQATGWKRQGNIVILEGARRLRFRIATN